jgi:hypothetical protein
MVGDEGRPSLLFQNVVQYVLKLQNASSSLGPPVGSHVIGAISDPGSSGFLSQTELQLSLANEPTNVGASIRKLPQMVKV